MPEFPIKQRHILAKATEYTVRVMQAYIRYYLGYTPDILERMTPVQLGEAFNDILFVREREKKAERS